MQYLCVKQLTLGGTTYNPGNVIQENIILPERIPKLLRNGFISKMDESGHENEVFTLNQVDKMLAEAIEDAVNNTITEMEHKQKELQEQLQQGVTELDKTGLETFKETIPIDIIMESDGDNGQHMTLPAKSEDIRQVFSIMQLNAEIGAKAVADVKSENVLMLLHAADSRKTIREAAKKQADKLFSTGRVLNESSSGNASTDTNTKGDDT